MENRQFVAVRLEGVEKAVQPFAAIDDPREVGQEAAREIMNVELFP